MREESPHALDLPCLEALIAAKTSSEPSALERSKFHSAAARTHQKE
jgi:hypothetical protein